MKYAKTMAYINLYSVLRNIEDLCRLDEVSKSMIADVDLSIAFIIKGGAKAALVFKNGECKFIVNQAKASIRLYFTSYKHFNDMVDGNAKPIPLKGLFKISFLTGTFTKLTERLVYFLRPDESLLADPKFKLIHTELMLYTAAFAAVQYANVDPIGKTIAKSIPDGDVAMKVKQGPAVNINVNHGYLTGVKEASQAPRARMDFSDMDAAFDLLSGRVDSYTCIASSRLALSGYIAILAEINKLLFHISAYLR